MLVYGLGKKTRHSQQTRLTVTSNHGRAKQIQAILTAVGGFLKRFARSAEQLSWKERWALLLKIILREFYQKRAGQTADPALAWGAIAVFRAIVPAAVRFTSNPAVAAEPVLTVM